MIVGIGVDIVEIQRIRDIIDVNSDRFIDKILNLKELKQLDSISNLDSFLSKKWAGKEAISKAFGCGIGKELSFHDICIDKMPNGKPFVEILKDTVNAIVIKDINIHISFSDADNYAIAQVVIETK